MLPTRRNEYKSFGKYDYDPRMNLTYEQSQALALAMLLTIRDIGVEHIRTVMVPDPGDLLYCGDTTPGPLAKKLGCKKKRHFVELYSKQIAWFIENAARLNLPVYWGVAGKEEMLKIAKLINDDIRTFIIPALEFELLEKFVLQNHYSLLKWKNWKSPFMCGFSKFYRGWDEMINHLENESAKREGILKWKRETDATKHDSTQMPLMFRVGQAQLFMFTHESGKPRLRQNLRYITHNTVFSKCVMRDGYAYEKPNGNPSGAAGTTQTNDLAKRNGDHYAEVRRLQEAFGQQFATRFQLTNAVEKLVKSLMKTRYDDPLFFDEFEEIAVQAEKALPDVDEIERTLNAHRVYFSYSDDQNKFISDHYKNFLTMEDEYRFLQEIGQNIKLDSSRDHERWEDITFLGCTPKKVDGVWVPVFPFKKGKCSIYNRTNQKDYDVLFQAGIGLMIETYYDGDSYERWLDLVKKLDERRDPRAGMKIAYDPEIVHLLNRIPTRSMIERLYLGTQDGGFSLPGFSPYAERTLPAALQAALSVLKS